MPLSSLSRGISRVTENISLKFRGQINFGVIYIEMVFKTKEQMNDQLERCYSKKKKRPRPKTWDIPLLKGGQMRESQQNTEKEWPLSLEENQEAVAEAKKEGSSRN